MNTAKSKLTVNAVSAIIQVAFTAILYFFLYKYLLNSIGIKQLGVWSLILSFSSIANLANFGITSGLVKFVAEYLTEDDKSKLGKLIFTSVISMTILFFLVSLVVFWGAHYFLHLVIDKEFLDEALQILPFSLVSLSLNAVSGVFTSVLEGYQKNYLRNFIYIFSGILMFVLVLIFTPIYHLKGVAMAQVCQAVFVLLVALILIFSISPNNRFTYWKWSKQSFKELFNYGYKFQLVSMSQLLYEPTTKLLLSKFGGLALLGHYEMANRLVSQFRALLVNANQVVVPVVAENSRIKTNEEKRTFFKRMNQILLLFSMPLGTLLVVLSPIISILWIGSLEIDFVFSMFVLTIAATFNVMCGPSYFSCMGEGKLNILVLIHISMAVMNLVFGYLFGLFSGGYGTIVGWGLSLSVGSVLLILMYSRTLSLSFFQIFSKNDIFLLAGCVVLVIFTLLFFETSWFSSSNNIKTLILSVIYLSVFIPVLMKNENLKNVITGIKLKGQ